MAVVSCAWTGVGYSATTPEFHFATNKVEGQFLKDENRKIAPDYGFVAFYAESYRPVIQQSGTKNSVFPALIGRGRLSGEWERSRGLIEGEAAFMVDNPSNRYVNIPEAYFEKDLSEKGTVSFGRRKQDWSRMDREWQLGMWEPRFRWNYIEPELVGLTGFFWNQEWRRGVETTMYATPIFVPEQAAPFDLRDGTFTSQHPFFSIPPGQIPLFGQNTKVRYDLDMPSVTNIVFQPALGFSARAGSRDGFWGRVSYAYQPINQLLMGYEGYLFINTADEVKVTLHPRVLYHHMAGAEAGITHSRWEGWVSVLGDRPVRDETPGRWTTQEVANSITVGGGADGKLFGEGDLAPRIGVSALRRWYGVRPDQGPLAGSRSIFESRFQYSTAASVKTYIPLFGNAHEQFAVASRFTYDLDVQGTRLSGEFRYNSKSRWSVTLGADVVSAQRSAAPQYGGADYFFLYRTYDRIRGSLAYAF